jgi:hypothetical protein
MDDWLASSLLLLNKEPNRIDQIRERLRRTLQNNWDIFGKHSFRKHRTPDQDRSPINAALFDVMSTGLGDIDRTLLRERADRLRQAFYARMNDDPFIKSITYSPNTPKVVRARFEMAQAMFSEVFGAA